MARPHHTAAGAVTLVLALVLSAALGACGDDAVSKDEFVTELRNDSGLSEAQASCVAEDVYDRLDQDDIDDVVAYTGDPDDEVSPKAVEALTNAITGCVGTGAPGPTDGG